MPSQWSEYYVFFLAGALPVIVTLVSYSTLTLFRRRANSEPGIREREKKTVGRVNLRYFLALNAAILLFVPGMLLLLPAMMLKHLPEGVSSLSVIITIALLVLFILLGVTYAVTKGDLGWVKTYRKGESSLE